MQEEPGKIKVMILDGDPLVHLGLETVLHNRPEIQLVGKAKTFQEAREQLEVCQPDILLTEFMLPDRSGADACREITKAFPKVRVLFLSLNQEKTAVHSAVLAGASGFLLKESVWDRLVPSLELVAHGHSIFGQDTLKEVQHWILEPGEPKEESDWGLSSQQTRVVELVAKGKTNKEIAATLDLSEKTVRNYLAAVFKKLHVSHRTRVASLFYERQMEPSQPSHS